MNTEKQKQEMSFLEHLEVFRWHLVRSVLAVLFFAVIAFIFKGILFDGILLAPKNPDFPTYKMLCYLSQQMGMGDALCMDELPFILMNISMSGQFGYYVISPLSVHFLGSYQVSETVANQISLSSFISTVTTVCLANGVVFELPILVYFLTKIGLLTPQFMQTYRKHALVMTLIFSAIITPPDITSQILVALPLMVLYEISIKISARVLRKQEKQLKKS